MTPAITGDLGLGCDGLVTGTIVVTGLSAGTPLTVIAEDGDGTASTTVAAQEGVTVVPVLGVVSDDAVLTVSVLFADDIITDEAHLPIRDLCTGTGTIVLDRDCATPDVVVATVHVTGLQGTEHLVGFVGTSGEKEIVLANPEVVTAVDGTVSGVFPLVSADGTIPLDALDGSPPSSTATPWRSRTPRRCTWRPASFPRRSRWRRCTRWPPRSPTRWPRRSRPSWPRPAWRRRPAHPRRRPAGRGWADHPGVTPHRALTAR